MDLGDNVRGLLMQVKFNTKKSGVSLIVVLMFMMIAWSAGSWRASFMAAAPAWADSRANKIPSLRAKN